MTVKHPACPSPEEKPPTKKEKKTVFSTALETGLWSSRE
jgi:hypothetical protein